MFPRFKSHHTDVDVVVGWGHKETSKTARLFAQKKSLPYLALEDGFLRSASLGVLGAPPLSIVVDDLGIYYDATKPCRLEQMLNDGGWETEEILARARKAIDWIIREKLSKYNHAPLLNKTLPGERREKVLVVDQTLGDASVLYGMADEETFRQMLQAARDENPNADIIVKTHPDVLAGKKRGYLTGIENSAPNVHLLSEEKNPLSLIEAVARVYTVTSQMGFEALLLGKQVECFGVPFYSGWGLSNDRQAVPRRTRKRTVEELFAATYILYPRYINPYTKESGTLEDVIEYLTLQVRHQRLLQSQTLLCTGFHWWKRPYIHKILKTLDCRLLFSKNVKSLERADKVVTWGDGSSSSLFNDALKKGLPVLRMEDGFLRSVGLGSNLVRPHSLVFDSRGIYYDPTRPSDLEALLRDTTFTAELCRRAENLRRRFVTERFSKYNVGDELPLVVDAAPGQVIILVPGQVEDDASIRLGCVDLRTNLELLVEVRRQNPGAYIIYKPHPDVVARNRRGEVSGLEAEKLSDLIVTDRSMPACLDVTDEVHTLTSLSGFEALLRGKMVVCYGLPFYAGWGLTKDRHALSGRRGRHLSIDELVAGVLILYPSYFNWQRGDLIPVEAALEQLGEERRSSMRHKTVCVGLLRQWGRKLSGFFSAIR